MNDKTSYKPTHTGQGFITAKVTAAKRISPNFVRLTVHSPELADWQHKGYDQWFRLVIPVPGKDTNFHKLAKRFDMLGYLRYLTLPKDTRPWIRNYTVRQYRQKTRELDIDFVTHGDDGIAGPWAARLPVGDMVAIVDQGLGYIPPQSENPKILVACDESALPAGIGILNDLPRAAHGIALFEIPDKQDMQEVNAPAGVDVRVLIRDSTARPGTLALTTLQQLPAHAYTCQAAKTTTSAHENNTTPQCTEYSAFIAGEQQLATGGRRFLVNEKNINKKSISFCGYWRLGHAH